MRAQLPGLLSAKLPGAGLGARPCCGTGDGDGDGDGHGTASSCPGPGVRWQSLESARAGVFPGPCGSIYQSLNETPRGKGEG